MCIGNKNNGISLLLLITVFVCFSFMFFTVNSVYADSDNNDNNEEITVYFTINDMNGFVVGNDDDHTIMHRVPIKLSYVDLAEYGLEKYNRYETETYYEDGIEKVRYKSGGNVVKQPTLLMLYLKALSKYYLNREITKEDIGNKDVNAITPTAEACSMFMTSFWGSGYNLLYYVNHEFPLMYEGWGATADFILLEDGDSIEVQLMPGLEINPFYRFEEENISNVIQGNSVDNTLYRQVANIYAGSTTSSVPFAGHYIRYSTNYGATWERTDIQSGDNGCFSFIPESCGVYYLTTSERRGSNEWHYGMPTSVVHVIPAKVTGGKCGTCAGNKIGFSFDSIKGADGYTVSYREQGASEWTEAKASTNEFILRNAKSGTVYEFKASAYVTDKYVADGEPYNTLTGEESDVVSYTVSTDPAVLDAADALAAVPEEADVELSDREVIETARSLYDALDADEKQNIAVSDVAKLEAAEARLAELQAEKDAKDRREAAAVTNMITALPSTTNVTYDDREQVLAAYDAYEALSPEGKAMVQSLSVKKLNNLKAKIDEWDREKKEEQDREDASAVTALIDVLPPAASVKLTDKAKVYAAYDAYQALTDGAKAKIGDYYISKLSDLKEKVDKLQKEADEKAEREKAAKKALAKKKAAAKKYATTGLKVKVKSRKFTVSWNKTKGATGYQVQYKLKVAKKWSALKTTKSLKAVSKKLKKGKKYSFRVRTYTVLSGSKVYGKWSGVKTAKCK